MIEELRQLCLRRAIFFPESEIYGGFAGFYNYGPIGLKIKKNFIQAWRKVFVEPDNIYEVETSLIQPKKVFEASGHLESFSDPIVQCKKCHSIHRADHLIEETLHMHVEGKSLDELQDIIYKNNIKCPKCKGELGQVRYFNLMFQTYVGPEGKEEAYLRPETAQGIFVAFRRLVSSLNPKLPFGIAQIGRSFRNEISPRHFLVRLRQFTQLEIEYFVHPKRKKIPNFNKWKNQELRILTREAQLKNEDVIIIKAKDAVKEGLVPHQALAYFMAKEMWFYKKLGIPEEALRFRHMLPEETPHYSKGNFDLEIKFDFGWKEVVGNAYRASYDLEKHAKHSGVELFVEEDGQKIVPHVIEPSFGVERSLYAVLLYALQDDGRGWKWLKLPAFLAPYKVAVFPLVKDRKQIQTAKKIEKKLKKLNISCYYEDRQSIGKRYAKADEIGVRYCITVDEQTLKDKTITVRDRDTKEQERIEITKLKSYLSEKLETI